MSFQATSWAARTLPMLPASIAPGARLVLMLLAESHYGQTDEVAVNTRTLAGAAGSTPRAVRNWITSLATAGALEARSTRGHGTSIRLLMDEAARNGGSERAGSVRNHRSERDEFVRNDGSERDDSVRNGGSFERNGGSERPETARNGGSFTRNGGSFERNGGSEDVQVVSKKEDTPLPPTDTDPANVEPSESGSKGGGEHEVDLFGKPDSDALIVRGSPEADFDAFWQAYPIREGKKPAREKFVSLPAAIRSFVIAHVAERARADPKWVRGFAPHPTTFLNQQRWTDEYDTQPHHADGPRHPMDEYFDSLRNSG